MAKGKVANLSSFMLEKFDLYVDDKPISLVKIIVSFDVIFNFFNSFPVLKFKVSTENNNLLDELRRGSGNKVSISYYSTFSEKEFTKREMDFYVTSLPSVPKADDANRNLYIEVFCVDKTYHDIISADRYNFFYESKTKSYILEDMFRHFLPSLVIKNMVKDTETFDYYMLKETFGKNLAIARMLGDEPYFIYLYDDILYIHNMASLYEQKTKAYFHVTSNAGKVYTDILENLNGINFNGAFFNSNADISGYNYFSYNPDTKNSKVEMIKVPYPNNKFEEKYTLKPSRDVNRLATFKECFYFTQTFDCEAKFPRTDMNVGDICQIDFENMTDKNTNASFSGKWFLYKIIERFVGKSPFQVTQNLSFSSFRKESF